MVDNLIGSIGNEDKKGRGFNPTPRPGILEDIPRSKLEISDVVAWYELSEKIYDNLLIVRDALTDDHGDLIAHGGDAAEIEDFQWAVNHIFPVLKYLDLLRGQMDYHVLPELLRFYLRNEVVGACE
jgi:hypothetical protein